MPGFGRYLRALAAGMAIPAVLVAVTACGSTTSAASSSASGSGSGSGSGSASAYFNCLREHGAAAGGFGSGSGTGNFSAASAARQACASLRPSGGFGGFSGFSGFGGGDFTAALQKFESCVKSHGVTLPSSSSSGGFRALMTELRSGSSADQAAFNDCRSDLPFPGGGAGSSSGGGSTA
jgi:hypothetical protein